MVWTTTTTSLGKASKQAASRAYKKALRLAFLVPTLCILSRRRLLCSGHHEYTGEYDHGVQPAQAWPPLVGDCAHWY
jgi:hypothetical protein